MTTDKATYAVGEPVTITVTMTNTGPPCTFSEQTGSICTGADVKDAQGNMVWTTWAPPTTGCAATSTPTDATVLPTGGAHQVQRAWQQDICTSRASNCSGQQVSPGQYEVFGDNWMHLLASVYMTIEAPQTAATPSAPSDAPPAAAPTDV